MARLVVIDHGAANIHSVVKALEYVGARPLVTSETSELARADGAVLPGVGTSDAALRKLDYLGLTKQIREFGRSGRPLFGICLGMQLLFPNSEEGELEGISLIDGTVIRLPNDQRGSPIKVPHMGWNRVEFCHRDGQRHPALVDLPNGSHLYFVHSYYCVPVDKTLTVATTTYGLKFSAVIAKGEILGTQFHPEKSGDMGLTIYENFVKHVDNLA